MKLVAFMRDLVAKGMSWEDAATFAERFEEGVEEALERAVPVRSANAERQARYRQRKAAAAPIVTETVTLSVTDVIERKSPTPPKKYNPSPPLKGGISPQISASLPEKPKPKTIGAWTSEIWEITPRPGRTRSGKALLETALKAAIRKGHDPGRVKAGVGAYYDSPDATKNDGQYAQGVHVVINSGRWEAFAEDADRPPDDDPDPWRPRLLNWRINRYWNSEWGPKPGEGGYRGPSEPEARAA